MISISLILLRIGFNIKHLIIFLDVSDDILICENNWIFIQTSRDFYYLIEFLWSDGSFVSLRILEIKLVL